MDKTKLFEILIVCLFWLSVAICYSQDLPDISTVPIDLQTPKTINGKPVAGKRIRIKLDKYEVTNVYHVVYLPSDWKPGKRFPLIVEYPGNGPYRNKFGDTNSGKVEDCNLGYGISGGEKFVWLCLPFVSADGQHHQLQWWGNRLKTVDYCKLAVEQTLMEYCGKQMNESNPPVILAGFSRGSIACNYIGLADDEIAKLWSGMICHSHYDGVRKWPYPDSNRTSAILRLKRLGNIPQWISHEGSVDDVRSYLSDVCPDGHFTFQRIPFHNHTDSWVLRDLPERIGLREWVDRVIKGYEKSHAQ